jgi:hypothetical protein
MESANSGQLPVTECVNNNTEIEGENAEFQPPPDPPNDVDQEIEISAESDIHGNTILGFQPLNPENSPERRADYYLPVHSDAFLTITV